MIEPDEHDWGTKGWWPDCGCILVLLFLVAICVLAGIALWKVLKLVG